MTILPPSPFLDPGAPPSSEDSAVTPQMGDGRLSIPAGYVLVSIDELRCWRDDLAYYREKEREELLLPAFLHERPLRDIADAMMTPRNRRA